MRTHQMVSPHMLCDQPYRHSHGLVKYLQPTYLHLFLTRAHCSRTAFIYVVLQLIVLLVPATVALHVYLALTVSGVPKQVCTLPFPHFPRSHAHLCSGFLCYANNIYHTLAFFLFSDACYSSVITKRDDNINDNNNTLSAQFNCVTPIKGGINQCLPRGVHPDPPPEVSFNELFLSSLLSLLPVSRSLWFLKCYVRNKFLFLIFFM